MKASIYPIKGQYLPGENITLRFDSNELVVDCVHVVLYSLGRIIQEFDIPVYKPKTDINIPSLSGNFNGYGVKTELYKDGKRLKVLYTAFNVSDPGRLIRYGFLSDFSKGDEEDVDIKAMAKYHINTVQFYDWSHRPDQLVAHSENYSDLMGKENCKSVVKKKIDQCHAHGMRAVGYGAVYSASKEYQNVHPEQSLFTRQGAPICFIEKFYIMNISRGCPWHNHIISQYQEAVKEFGFDGIHMDTYGFPKAALNANGEAVFLEDHINALIENTKEALTGEKKEPCLIFNNVGGWPAETTKHAPQECVYIEVWPPLDQYYHLKQLIMDAKKSGRPVVLAAYPAPFRTDKRALALESEMLCSLVIALNGATQLFVGEENAVITQGYYADYSRLTSNQVEAIMAYQNFFVQYQELLFDDTLKDVSLTHIGWDNTEYGCDASFSVTGESDKLWLSIRENKNFKIIGMVNLCGNDNIWNRGKHCPQPLSNVKFRMQTIRTVKHVWYASPDEEGGMAATLPFDIEKTSRGDVVLTTIPMIKHGGILWMEEKE